VNFHTFIRNIRIIRPDSQRYTERLEHHLDDPELREARIQAHMARIRSDPRWQEDRYRRKATPGMVDEIRERYLEHWSTLKRQRKTAMQREIAREYRVSALIVYRILAGRYWRE